MPISVRWRIVAAVMLVAGVFVLFTANRVTEKIEKQSALKQTLARPLLRQIDTVIDSLLDQYQIERTWVKSWNVLTPGRRFIREQRSIFVPAEFVSLDFNHDLSHELSRFDVRVIATERTRESTVSMHIISDGMIVESISFIVRRDLR